MAVFNLAGLDGANLLGFLAALGTLRTASARWRTELVEMGWDRASGGWRPQLKVGFDLDEAALIEGVHSQLLKMKGHRVFDFANNLTIKAETFREVLIEACDSDDRDRVFSDFMAAFGSEMISNKGVISDTALRTMGGAGHQHFLGFMRSLAEETTTENLLETLMEPWRYQDDKPSMRWDPNDDRRHALRWNDPSGDTIKTVRGANRLAIEGLPLLPTMPVGGRLETTGFTQNRHSGVLMSWPLWEPSIPVDIVRSLLALRELQAKGPNREMLAALGIGEVFRCRRITQGKYRNFTPAAPA